MAPFQGKQQKYYELAGDEDETRSFFHDSEKITPKGDSRCRNPESNWWKFWPWLVHIIILLTYTVTFFNGKRVVEIREGFSCRFYSSIAVITF
jgi:hypothetical protein